MRTLTCTLLSAAILAGFSPARTIAGELETDAPDAEEVFDTFQVPLEARDSIEAERLIEDEARHRPVRPGWAGLLPRMVIQSSQDEIAGARRNTKVLLLADFPVGKAPPARSLLDAAATPRPGEPPDDLLPPAPQPAPARLPSQPPQPPQPQPSAPVVVPACLAGLRDAALEAAFGAPGRLRTMATRARRSAWLPELRIRVDRRFGRNESLDQGLEIGATPPELATVNEIRYEARAIWDLNRLVFAPEELAVEAQSLRLADARRALASLVNRLFFRRRTLRGALAGPLDAVTDADPDAAGRAFRLAEIDAELDALTSGLSRTCL